MLEIGSRDQQAAIVHRLVQEDVRALVNDPHANHVMQCLVETQSSASMDFVVQYFLRCAVESSTDRYASRVLLKFIEHGATEAVSKVLCDILPKVSYLIDDQFGNYVVQAILTFGTHAEVRAAITALFGSFTSMSMRKFASNVVETTLRVATAEERVQIISEVLDGASFTLDKELGDSKEAEGLRGVAVSPLVAIMVHPYGNYVVQRMLEYGSPEQQDKIVGRITALAAGLEKGKFGKYLLASVQDLSSLPIMLQVRTATSA